VLAEYPKELFLVHGHAGIVGEIELTVLPDDDPPRPPSRQREFEIGDRRRDSAFQLLSSHELTFWRNHLGDVVNVELRERLNLIVHGDPAIVQDAKSPNEYRGSSLFGEDEEFERHPESN
jgi:hypothetical protein